MTGPQKLSEKDQKSSQRVKNGFIRLNYTIESRIWKDVNWLKGWCRNMKPEWSEWDPVYSYSRISNAEKTLNLLVKEKHRRIVKTEYRLIKEYG